jgi:hypothetical protein
MVDFGDGSDFAHFGVSGSQSGFLRIRVATTMVTIQVCQTSTPNTNVKVAILSYSLRHRPLGISKYPKKHEKMTPQKN